MGFPAEGMLRGGLQARLSPGEERRDAALMWSRSKAMEAGYCSSPGLLEEMAFKRDETMFRNAYGRTWQDVMSGMTFKEVIDQLPVIRVDIDATGALIYRGDEDE